MRSIGVLGYSIFKLFAVQFIISLFHLSAVQAGYQSNTTTRMSVHKHFGNEWMQCTLCRSQRQSLRVLQKAKQRQVTWPKPKDFGRSPVEDPVMYTSIDDAFANLIQTLGNTSRNCKRFYKSCSPGNLNDLDHLHCARFHTQAYAKAVHKNPLETAEDIHMVVHPGTYAVTAGEWGTKRQQTHVVHVEPGQAVELDFVL